MRIPGFASFDWGRMVYREKGVVAQRVVCYVSSALKPILVKSTEKCVIVSCYNFGRSFNIIGIYCSTIYNKKTKPNIISEALQESGKEDFVLVGDLNIKNLDFPGKNIFNPVYDILVGRTRRRMKVDYIVSNQNLSEMSVFHTKVHEKPDHLAISAIVRMPHCDYYPRVIDTKIAGRLAKVDLLQTGWPHVEPLLAIYRKANYRVGVNMKVAIAELEAVPVSRNSVQYTMEKLFDEKDRHSFYEFVKRLHSGNISVPAVFEWRGTKYYSREDSMNIEVAFGSYLC